MREGTYKGPSPFHYLFTFDLAHKSNITVQVRNINSIINVFKKTLMTVPHRLSRETEVFWKLGLFCFLFFFFKHFGLASGTAISPHSNYFVPY